MATPAPGPRFFGPMWIVRDLAASLRFYRDVLRLDGDGEAPYAEFGSEGSSKFVLLDSAFWSFVGGALVSPSGGPSPDSVVLAITVANIDAEYTRLRGEGVAIAAPPADRPQMGLRNVVLRDPDGHAVELYSDRVRPAQT